MRKTDAPRWLLDFLRVHSSRVMWATREELKEEPPRKSKRIPFGEPAGGRQVIGHGNLVAFSGRNLLTCDIKAAILDGYQWPWDAAKPYVVEPDHTRPQRFNVAHVAFIRDTWRLDGNGVVWRKDTPPQYAANSTVLGTVIAGRDEVMVTRKGVGYMLKDIIFTLENGYLPGQWQPDWD